MPEQKSVSPLLDGFTLGDAIGTHCGVSCYPAIKENSDQRYIVKSISIPQSQVQLDALLITGAYKDPASAAEYFHELSEEIISEADFLQKMSKLEGFLPYLGSQIVPMEKNQLGYEVILLSEYRLSLAKFMQRHSISHLAAVNLGIDMCAALAACRRAGMIYIALKPSNIFISPRKEFLIGDLGFVPLASLKYATMPDRYRSAYTPPESGDDLAALNDTADTYALGMILYQIFNHGQLPDRTEALNPPANGDREIQRIILKACDPDPAKRWKDPAQMGQALVIYMQRNNINNTLIMEPLAVLDADEGSKPAAEPEAAGAVPETAGTEETPAAADEPSCGEPQDATVTDDSAFSAEEAADPAAADAPDLSAGEAAEEPVVLPEITEPEEPASQASAADTLTNSAPDAVPEIPIAFKDAAFVPNPETSADASSDFEKEKAEAASLLEVGASLQFAPTSLSEKESEPTVTPFEDFTLPTTAFDEDELMFREMEELSRVDFDSELAEVNRILVAPNAKEKEAPKRKKHENITPVVIKEKKKHPFLNFLLVLLLIAFLGAAAASGYFFYNNYYIQKVDALSVDGSLDQITVTIQAKIDNSLLSVVCSDPYGNTLRQNVKNNQAVFTDLTPGSLYKIELEISGAHKLVGPTSDIYTMESLTNVASFSAITGSDSGSAQISITVDGHEPEEWRILYIAEGEAELGHSFTGHATVINNLVIGKTYTFTLETADGTPVTGQNTLEFTPRNLVVANELTVVSVENGELTAEWKVSADADVESWHVRCTGEGYEQTQDVTEPRVVFTQIDPEKSYTVEVTAHQMTQSAHTTITSNPITLTAFNVDDSEMNQLSVSWDYEGDAPENGWLLMYNVDGNTTPNAVKCDIPYAVISPKIPGASYHFTIQTAENVSVFNGSHTYQCPEAEYFMAHAISHYAITPTLLPTPSDPDWNCFSVSSDDYSSDFTPGQDISIILYVNSGFYLDDVSVSIMYVVRDENGNALPEHSLQKETNWAHMWEGRDYHYCPLNAIAAPKKAGSYTLELYFDGAFATSADFTVS